MLVLAAVSDVQYQRLRGAVMPRFTLARAATWDVALETIKCRPVEIAVVDPMLGGARGSWHLRPLVCARRFDEPTRNPGRGPRAVRAPPASGPGLYDRGRGEAPRLRPGEDFAAACPQVPRFDGRRNEAFADR